MRNTGETFDVMEPCSSGAIALEHHRERVVSKERGVFTSALETIIGGRVPRYIRVDEPDAKGSEHTASTESTNTSSLGSTSSSPRRSPSNRRARQGHRSLSPMRWKSPICGGATRAYVLLNHIDSSKYDALWKPETSQATLKRAETRLSPVPTTRSKSEKRRTHSHRRTNLRSTADSSRRRSLSPIRRRTGRSPPRRSRTPSHDTQVRRTTQLSARGRQTLSRDVPYTNSSSHELKRHRRSRSPGPPKAQIRSRQRTRSPKRSNPAHKESGKYSKVHSETSPRRQSSRGPQRRPGERAKSRTQERSEPSRSIKSSYTDRKRTLGAYFDEKTRKSSTRSAWTASTASMSRSSLSSSRSSLLEANSSTGRRSLRRSSEQRPKTFREEQYINSLFQVSGGTKVILMGPTVPNPNTK